MDQPPALKRIRFEHDGATHTVDVLVDDPETVIVTYRRQSLSTFYLCDRSGALKRAVENNASIADGGLTNLTTEAAGGDFEGLKQLWLRQTQP